jgi:hypothetical protein
MGGGKGPGRGGGEWAFAGGPEEAGDGFGIGGAEGGSLFPGEEKSGRDWDSAGPMGKPAKAKPAAKKKTAAKKKRK